jgi:hypothetical protein
MKDLVRYYIGLGPFLPFVKYIKVFDEK